MPAKDDSRQHLQLALTTRAVSCSERPEFVMAVVGFAEQSGKCRNGRGCGESLRRDSTASRGFVQPESSAVSRKTFLGRKRGECNTFDFQPETIQVRVMILPFI